MNFNIIDAYTRDDRHYHNITHISNMLANLNNFNLNPIERIKLHYSILYHDVIYDPESDNNEEDSAVYFMRDLMNGNIEYNKNIISATDLGSVVWVMIHSTKHHNPTSDMCKYLIDLDLWELTDNNRYKENVKLIRKEYNMFSDKEFKIGRIEWISYMLHKKQIFYTDYCIENGFEELARKNLQAELDE